jgi:hypothetical protein
VERVHDAVGALAWKRTVRTGQSRYIHPTDHILLPNLITASCLASPLLLRHKDLSVYPFAPHRYQLVHFPAYNFSWLKGSFCFSLLFASSLRVATSYSLLLTV